MDQVGGQEESKPEARRRIWRATWRQALTAITIGWDLAIPIFGGVLFGHYLDRRLATGLTFTVGLMVLGLMVGVYNAACTLQREIRRNQPRARCQGQGGKRQDVDHL